MLVQLQELRTEDGYVVAEYVAGCSVLRPDGWKALTVTVGMEVDGVKRMHEEHGVVYVRDYFAKMAEDHADVVMAMGEAYAAGERYYEEVDEKWKKISH